MVVVVCAATYSGYYQKWHLRDDSPRFTVRAMLDGAAYRPFVYRRLLPESANLAARVTPARVQHLVVQAFDSSKKLYKSRDSTDPHYAFRYDILYTLGFFCLVVAAGLMIATAAREFSTRAALLATCTFLLFFPILQTKGGYVYDFSELMFFSAALMAAREGQGWLLIPLAVIGAYNKESFFFFIPALLPYFVARHRLPVALAWIGAACAVALGVYALIWRRYATNPGLTVEFHLLQNVGWYANPLNLFQLETTYGVKLFAGFSIVTFGLLIFLIAWGWSGLQAPDRRHLILAAVINTPLMVLFAANGEVRNLSLTFPGLVLLSAAAFQRLLAGRLEPARPAQEETIWSGAFAKEPEPERAEALRRNR
jgi:hypothetical protein